MAGLCILHWDEQLAAQKLSGWLNANLLMCTCAWLTASGSNMCDHRRVTAWKDKQDLQALEEVMTMMMMML